MTTAQDIRNLEDRRYKAMVGADKSALNELLADDLIYTHSNAVIDTKQSYIDGILGGRWASKSLSADLSALTIAL